MMIYTPLHKTLSFCFFSLMTDSRLHEEKQSIWCQVLIHVLLFIETECNILEATPSPSSPVPNFTHPHLVTQVQRKEK